MASENRLYTLVDQRVRPHWNAKYFSLGELAEIYKEICKSVRVPMLRDDGSWEPWNEARPWGAGPNEDFKSFVRACAHRIFGVLDWPSDAATEAELDMAAQYRIAVGDLCWLVRLQQQPEFDRLWAHFLAVKNDRSEGSPYYFANIKVFTEVVEARGAEYALRYNRAAWWSSVEDLVSDEITTAEALTLVRWERKVPYSQEPVSCLALLLAAYGPAKVNALVEKGYTAQAIRLVLRCPEVEGRGWLQAIAPTMHRPEWQTMPSSVLLNIADDAFGQIGNVGYRERLILGDKPKELADNLLTAREAHEWVQSGCSEEPLQFLMSSWGFPDKARSAFRHTQTRIVVEWFHRKHALKSMTKERVVHGPAGEVRSFTYMDLLDEISAADLINGSNTDPDLAFQRAAQRREQEIMKRLEKSVPLPRFEGEENPEAAIKQILSSDELIEEGKSLGHCVGAYVQACQQKRSYIFRVLLNPKERSTIELARDRNGGNVWKIYQHRSFRNSRPTEQEIAIAKEWAAANGFVYLPNW